MPKKSVNVERIDLGRRLNHLINRESPLGRDNEAHSWGLVLPRDDIIGSGIVIIIGEPGSGKSTLGLQIAVAAAEEGCDAAYLSLEEDPRRVIEKAKIFGWSDHLRDGKRLTTFGSVQPIATGRAATPDAGGLQKILQGFRGVGDQAQFGKILLPGLPPRPVSQEESRLNAFFWDQYRQIEFLVLSASAQNRASRQATISEPTGIRLVVIDSLNMLGVDLANREMYHRLFDLFRHNQIMGVFTVEANDDAGFDSTMGDVVINFTKDLDSGYEVKFVECAKSRFFPQTLGRHPYKIKAANPLASARGEIGIVPLLSLHAVVADTSADPPSQVRIDGDPPVRVDGFPFGWGDEITSYLLRSTLRRGNVVALAGPTGTFKTQIALNFLLHGVATKETVLYIRLRMPEPLKLASSMMPYVDPVIASPSSQDGVGDPKKRKAMERRRQREENARSRMITLRKRVVPYKVTPPDLERIGSAKKLGVSLFRSTQTPKKYGKIILADFRPGMLLPEEFIDAISEILQSPQGKNIRRVVLDDVGLIGPSYPLLKRSLTTGEFFLSAFLHVMKNKGVDLLLVGTMGDLVDANQMVNQSCSLADAVLRTSIGTVFGDKYVLLSGDGMAARQPNNGDSSPVVLLPEAGESSCLKPDAHLLDEFVGFDSRNIKRPGIVLHLFEGNRAQADYNRTLLQRVRERYGAPQPKSELQDIGVRMLSFKPENRAQLASAHSAFHERPRDHTAVRMIDEFEVDERQNIIKDQFSRNVLLLAYNSQVPGADAIVGCRGWSELYDTIQGLGVIAYPHGGPESQKPAYPGRRFAYDRVSPETVACLVLEAVAIGEMRATGNNREIFWSPENGDQISFPETFTSAAQQAIARQFHDIHRLILTQTHDSRETAENALPPDATVYLCWYSQLRELLNRAPHLGSQLKICSLPHKGFRGDWAVRVEPGSVSLRLGKAIIGDLCSTSENFDRFRDGIGIPVKEKMDTSNLMAWPAAPADLPMSKLESIWESARRRSRVVGYGKFNRLFYGIGEILAGKHRDPFDRSTAKLSYFKDLAKRLPGLVHAILNGNSDRQ